jgi:fibronectin type 3 domain-containing protein
MIRHKGIIYYLISVICILFLLTSCGKKGDPTLKSYEKPDPPSALRAVHRESEITLLWEFPKDKEPAIKRFYLMKSTGRDFEKIATLENNKRSYIDNDFKIGSKYKYKIVSQNLKNVISNDSNIIQIAPETVPPPPGKILFKVEHNSLTLNWESAGDRILYNIYKSNEKGIYRLMPVHKEPIKETSFRDNFTIKGHVYYTIRSLVGSDIRDEGPASEEVEINPLEFVPSSPSGLQAIAKKENVYLIWKEAPETWVVGYRVYRETNKKEGFIFIGETQIPVFLDRDKPLTKRSYRITALGTSKESPSAEIKDVVFTPHR